MELPTPTPAPHAPASPLHEFEARAILLGHDIATAHTAEGHTTYFTVPTVEDVRRVVSNATPAQRAAREKTFFNPSLLSRSRLGQGMHDRGEAIVFAEGAMKSSDARGLNNHLPAHIKAVSIAHKVIRAGEVWDVSVRAEAWGGLDPREEMYVTVNVGTLVIEPGGRLIIQGNVFSLLCQTLIASEEGEACQIGILPTPFAPECGCIIFDGVDGMHGSSGAHGQHGRPLLLEHSFLGAMIQGEIDTAAMQGARGKDGQDGGNGAKGFNGGMCKIAELTLRQVTGKLTIFSQAGKGGDGGNGGDAGHGGHGGNGAPGYRGISGKVPGGHGGDGGDGGQGGDGGHGGHGGLASNIYITVPPTCVDRLSIISRPSEPGMGGQGGQGGRAGMPGDGGTCQDQHLHGQAGHHGAAGTAGKHGLNGRTRPAAVMHLNDIPLADITTPHRDDVLISKQ